MTLFTDIVFFLYLLSALALFAYGLNCYYMVWHFWRSFRQGTERCRTLIKDSQYLFESEETTPYVTTQIPLYNEANVAERVIRAVAAIDYPANRHEIQVLDDSNDETREIVDQIAADLRAEGKNVEVIRRDDRSGFKAGALAYGMQDCKGEYIAIFDSDFVPTPDFLRDMVPVIHTQSELGFAQARWGHLNPEESHLTRAQSLGIDGHFMIEQSVRAFNGLFMNFNGTAGVWRKQAIEDAGNWQSDTLTEDMDLSYRCQLAGWKASYVPDVVVPAELPETYTAFKSQQFRWAKGSIQTAVKLLPRIMRAEASWMKKLQSVFHLTHYSIHPLMAILSILALPVLLTLDVNMPAILITVSMIGILLAMFGPSSMYVTSQIANHGKGAFSKLRFMPALMCVGVGIALSNTRAVFEALFRIDSAFIRTPKKGSKTVKVYRAKTPVLPWLEIGLGFYCLFSMYHYILEKKYLVGPFLLMYACGFLIVGFNTLREKLQG